MAVALPVPEIEADLGGADGQTVDYVLSMFVYLPSSANVDGVWSLVNR